MKIPSGTNCRVRKLKSIPEKDIDPRKASLVFDNVTFRYPGSDHDTLKDISFSLAPDEKLAVVGLNGAGKTTVIKLILRLYKPSAGKSHSEDMIFGKSTPRNITALIGTVRRISTCLLTVSRKISFSTRNMTLLGLRSASKGVVSETR